jgi:translation initiation factor 1 (eIF-1/SUI1)
LEEEDGPKVTASMLDKKTMRVAGLPESSLKKYLSAFKKGFNCGGQIKKEGTGMVLLLQGDHRLDIKDFLEGQGIKCPITIFH